MCPTILKLEYDYCSDGVLKVLLEQNKNKPMDGFDKFMNEVGPHLETSKLNQSQDGDGTTLSPILPTTGLTEQSLRDSSLQPEISDEEKTEGSGLTDV